MGPLNTYNLDLGSHCIKLASVISNLRTLLHFGCPLNPSVNLSLELIDFRLLMQEQEHIKASNNYWKSETVATSHGSFACLLR